MSERTKHVYPEHRDMVLSLLEHFELADTSALEGGRAWYTEAQREARRLAREGGTTVARAAGIIAALSPQLQWGVNVRIARQVVLTGEAQEGCLRASEDKAIRIQRGERPVDVLSGPKVTAFYRAIMGDPTAAVLDTWMFLALGWPEGGTRSGKHYERAAAALTEAAERVNMSVPQFQAVVWWQVRGVKPLDQEEAA